MSSYCHPTWPKSHKIVNGKASFLAGGPIQALSHDGTLAPKITLCSLQGSHLVTLLGHPLVVTSGFTKSKCDVTNPKPTATGTCLVQTRTFLFWQRLQFLKIRSSFPPILGPGALTLPRRLLHRAACPWGEYPVCVPRQAQEPRLKSARTSPMAKWTPAAWQPTSRQAQHGPLPC